MMVKCFREGQESGGWAYEFLPGRGDTIPRMATLFVEEWCGDSAPVKVVVVPTNDPARSYPGWVAERDDLRRMFVVCPLVQWCEEETKSFSGEDTTLAMSRVKDPRDEQIRALKKTKDILLRVVWDAAVVSPEMAEGMIAMADVAVGWTKENPVYAFGKPDADVAALMQKAESEIEVPDDAGGK